MADLLPPYLAEREKKIILSRLMHSMMSFQEICMVMCAERNARGEPGFKMTEPAVRQLMDKIYAEWANDDDHWQERARPAARRRIYDHIRGAKKDGKWNAVANFEKTLSKIEGTEYDAAAPMASSAVLSDAMKEVMTELEAEEIEELIQEERDFMDSHSALPASGIIDIQRSESD